MLVRQDEDAPDLPFIVDAAKANPAKVKAKATMARKGAAITRVTLKRMGPAVLPLPPLAEQRRIVAKVDELMALCDRLEENLRSANEHRRRLLEATLHEALAPVEEMPLQLVG